MQVQVSPTHSAFRALWQSSRYSVCSPTFGVILRLSRHLQMEEDEFRRAEPGDAAKDTSTWVATTQARVIRQLYAFPFRAFRGPAPWACRLSRWIMRAPWGRCRSLSHGPHGSSIFLSKSIGASHEGYPMGLKCFPYLSGPRLGQVLGLVSWALRVLGPKGFPWLCEIRLGACPMGPNGFPRFCEMRLGAFPMGPKVFPRDCGVKLWTALWTVPWALWFSLWTVGILGRHIIVQSHLQEYNSP